LPFPTAFYSAQWEPFPWLPRNVGEVYPSTIEFHIPEVLAGFDYEHICGTAEDFAIGAVFNPDLPPVQRDADGIPLCCEHQVNCPTEKCEQFVQNGQPASRHYQYAIPAIDAVAETPVVVQFVANLASVSPALSASGLTYYPGGFGIGGYITEARRAGMTGVPFDLQQAVVFNGSKFVSQRFSDNQVTWEVTDLPTVTGTMDLIVNAGSIRLTGSNMDVDPALVPYKQDLRTADGNFAPAGSVQSDATPVTSDFATIDVGSSGEGLLMQSKEAAFYVWWFPGGAVANTLVYPPTGEAWSGLAANAPFDISVLGIGAFEIVQIFRFIDAGTPKWSLRKI